MTYFPAIDFISLFTPAISPSVPGSFRSNAIACEALARADA
jgi:hypothetical protein